MAQPWDELYARWGTARDERRHRDLQLVARDSQRAGNNPSAEDLEWLTAALADPERRWFVAMVYRSQPVPRPLLVAMVRAGATDCDASACRLFVEPCVETFGSEAVVAELGRYAAEGGERASLGYRKCSYWVRPSASFSRGMRPKPKPADAEPRAAADRGLTSD
jgi:hypothetical protein